MGKFSLMLVW